MGTLLEEAGPAAVGAAGDDEVLFVMPRAAPPSSDPSEEAPPMPRQFVRAKASSTAVFLPLPPGGASEQSCQQWPWRPSKRACVSSPCSSRLPPAATAVAPSAYCAATEEGSRRA